jgi:hypothetical protein
MRLHLQSVVTGAIASAAVALLFAATNVPAATAIDPAIDPTSALRGSLGASLSDLSLSNDFGRLSLLLNGGFALLFGAFASLAVARHRRDPITQRQHRGDDRSGQSVHST